MLRVLPNNEMLIRGIRVEANRGRAKRTSGLRQKTCQRRPHGFNFTRLHFPTNRTWLCAFSLVMDGGFHSIRRIREAVKESAGFVLANINWNSAQVVAI